MDFLYVIDLVSVWGCGFMNMPIDFCKGMCDYIRYMGRFVKRMGSGV